MLYLRRICHVSDYKEAIRTGCEELVRQGCVNPLYFNAIIQTIEKYGPYFYLGEGFCLPHAEPDEKVYSTGLCFVISEEPMEFFGHSVRVFIVLAAPDALQHQETLRKIAAACSDKKKRDAMLRAQSAAELNEIIGKEV